ncbi:uncharacterized protein LOC122063090 [Macadamia integrifolia]|uniref:uncharacterized protein LOC122063090 n=1 Tax=Macadamia integrifolia TaxID=60698 RepID=UPI001C4FD5AD|nr:uncharacterized protein LOC122063090 [Macadamia integrifolia]
MGDFNATLHSHEKRGPGNFSLGSAAEFGAMVDACSMSQVLSIGRKFTWTNNRCHGNVCSVLDRSFCDKEWLDSFQDYHDDFDRVVADSWSEWILGAPIYVLVNKLKKLKGVIRDWARSTFPHLDRVLEEANRVLAQIQEQIDTKGMDDQLYALEAMAKTTLIKVMENHEKMWAEKARIRWLKFGDRNSKFFLLSTKMRRNKNTIKSLKKQDGSMVDDPIQIGNYIVDFYENFHKATPTVQHEELLDNIPLILTKLIVTTWMPFLEIQRLKGLCGSLIRTARQGVNKNFLVLIPKVDGVDNLGNFRPLCMGNFFCKIITKVMALRLEPLLPRLISDEQGASPKGKIIHDNIIVASELANLIFSSTRGGGISIIDIRKAYDTIDWKFIFQVMHRFSFSERWIGWLNQILIYSKISILVNGGPQGFFNVERGLRQGDPISPILFIIVEEVLSRGLKGLIQSNQIKLIQGPRGAETPGHILFTDDIIIFTNASQSFPTKYLGVEIFKGRLKKNALMPVMDNVKKCHAGWKGKLLSMVGRTELVRSVISSIPTHNFAVY